MDPRASIGRSNGNAAAKQARAEQEAAHINVARRTLPLGPAATLTATPSPSHLNWHYMLKIQRVSTPDIVCFKAKGHLPARLAFEEGSADTDKRS